MKVYIQMLRIVALVSLILFVFFKFSNLNQNFELVFSITAISCFALLLIVSVSKLIMKYLKS
ncbi:hypothetical protein BCF50_2912 [Chryseobacterium daecheongense]|uniref:Uncharacterized protein n=1 Tax=Chryseobacterium daecheongense TaxID=192389 RepID=A0ABY2FTK7_9FLAO|nr:hypothetical protein BCF50_2912 [Chryseobacterium daecheongense]